MSSLFVSTLFFVHKMSALFVSTLFLCTKCLHFLCLLYFSCTKCLHTLCLLYFCARNVFTFCVYFIFVHKMSALFVSTLFLCTKCLHVLCLLYFLCTKCLHFLCLLCFWLIHRSNGFHSSAAFHSSVARKPKGRGKSCVAAHLRVYFNTRCIIWYCVTTPYTIKEVDFRVFRFLVMDWFRRPPLLVVVFDFFVS